MTKYITITMLSLVGYSINAQTTHQVAVAINQGIECPIIAGLEKSDLFSVFPNPVESSFTIQSPYKEAEIKLIDLNGRNVRSKKMLNGTIQIVVSDLPKGIYIIHFLNESGSDHIKIKIQ